MKFTEVSYWFIYLLSPRTHQWQFSDSKDLAHFVYCWHINFIRKYHKFLMQFPLILFQCFYLCRERNVDCSELYCYEFMTIVSIWTSPTLLPRCPWKQRLKKKACMQIIYLWSWAMDQVWWGLGGWNMKSGKASAKMLNHVSHCYNIWEVLWDAA